MAASKSVPNRATWFVIWAAFTAAPVFYYFVGSLAVPQQPASPQLSTLRPVFGALAALGAAGGAFLLTRAPRARADAEGLSAFFGGAAAPPPDVFLRSFITATAWAESCAIYGFILHFLGAPIAEYLPFGGGTLVAMLGAGLPAGLRYWSEAGPADGPGTGPTG